MFSDPLIRSISGSTRWHIQLLVLPFFLFGLALRSALHAQGSANDCNWNIVVHSSPQPTGAINDPGVPADCQDQTSCLPLFYYVYLERDGDAGCTGTGCPYTIDIEDLSVLGKLTVYPGSYTNKALSKLNRKSSIECTPVALNDPLNPDAFDFSVDEADGLFSFYYSGLTGETTSLTVYGGKLLFVVAVDAVPGETVELSTTKVTLRHPGQSDCANMAISTGNGKGVAIPSACALSSLTMRLGVVEDDPTTDFPNRKRVAVYMTSPDATPTSYTIDALDFLMEINSTQFMGEAFIQYVNPSMTETVLYKEPPANSSMDRRVYAKGAQIELITFQTNTPDNDNTLFYLVFNGPLLASDCAITTVEITDIRRMLLSGVCCAPNTGSKTKRDIDWGNSSDCPTNCPFNTVKVEEPFSIPSVINECTDMFFNVNLYAALTKTYEAAKVVLDVHYSGATLSWSESLSSSNYCTPSVCISAAPLSGQNDVLRVTIDIFGAAMNVGPSSPISLARLGFQGSETCITGVEVYDAYLIEENGTQECLPQFESIYNIDIGSDDLCTKRFSYKFRPWKTPSATVENVNYTLAANQTGCNFSGVSTTGTGSLCLCELNGQVFTPTKDDNHLNGVSTYDLVLISRHILGLEPFSFPLTFESPYRMIAADANVSGSITTFDIVEFRKLILGIYTELPNNVPSWRLVDAAYAFPNPANPFEFTFPETVIVDNDPPASNVGDFIALKVGDVNGSAMNSRPAPSTSAGIGYAVQTNPAAKGDATLTVPVYARKTLTASGWQMALRYDPARFRLREVRLVGPEMAGALNNGWHEPAPGEVRVLWFDADAQTYTYEEGEPLFFLELEALDQQAELTLGLDEQVLYAEAYDTLGVARRFALEQGEAAAVRPAAAQGEETPAPLWSARVYPNPNTGVFRLNLVLPEAGAVTLQLTDQQGGVLHRRELDLPAGDTTIGADAWPRLQPGTYILHVKTAFGAQQHSLVVTSRL